MTWYHYIPEPVNGHGVLAPAGSMGASPSIRCEDDLSSFDNSRDPALTHYSPRFAEGCFFAVLAMPTAHLFAAHDIRMWCTRARKKPFPDVGSRDWPRPPARPLFVIPHLLFTEELFTFRLQSARRSRCRGLCHHIGARRLAESRTQRRASRGGSANRELSDQGANPFPHPKP